MPFNSLPYLAFLFVAVAAYWLLPPRFRRSFVWLASLAFYASWGVVFVWVPLLAAGVVYLFGKQIQSDSTHAREWMWLGTSFALAVLIFFKYRGFLLFNLNLLAKGLGAHPISLSTAIAFPVG